MRVTFMATTTLFVVVASGANGTVLMTSEKRTPDAERAALESLIHSDGWQIVQAIVADHYGPAQQIADIDAVMGNLRPGDDERAIVTQIRAAAKAAHDVLVRTQSRYEALDKAAKRKALPERAFAPFRRVGA